MKPGPKPKPIHKKVRTRTFVMRDDVFNYVKYAASELETNRSKALIKMINYYKVNSKINQKEG